MMIKAATLLQRQTDLQSPRRGPGRIQILDGLRLLAALLVVCWHYAAFGHDDDLHPYAKVSALYPVAAYGWLGVELFFLISGFVIAMSSMGRTVPQFITSRVTRLYPAYWFGILLTTIITMIWSDARTPPPLSDVAVNLTMLESHWENVQQVDAVYWTLWVELHFYVLFLLVVWRGFTYRKASLFCAVWLVGCYVFRTPYTHANLFLIAQYAPFFIAGLAFFLIRQFGNKPILWVYIGVSFWLGLPIVKATVISSNNHLATPMPILPAIIILAGFFVLMAAVALDLIRARWKWLTVAGALTYPLYLVHEYIGWTILKALDPHLPGWVLLIGTVALMLGAAWLIHRYVERPVAPLLRRALTALFALLGRVWAYARGRLHAVPTARPVAHGVADPASKPLPDVPTFRQRTAPVVEMPERAEARRSP